MGDGRSRTKERASAPAQVSLIRRRRENCASFPARWAQQRRQQARPRPHHSGQGGVCACRQKPGRPCSCWAIKVVEACCVGCSASFKVMLPAPTLPERCAMIVGSIAPFGVPDALSSRGRQPLRTQKRRVVQQTGRLGRSQKSVGQQACPLCECGRHRCWKSLVHQSANVALSSFCSRWNSRMMHLVRPHSQYK